MNFSTPYVEVHVFRETGDIIEFLALKRARNEMCGNVGQMVTGKIREAEIAVKSGVRELTEETGLSPLKMWTAPHVNSFYNHLDDTMNMLPVFVCQVDCNQSVVISHEHCAYRWVGVDEAKQLYIWEGQRKAAEIIYNYLTDEREALNFTEIELL